MMDQRIREDQVMSPHNSPLSRPRTGIQDVVYLTYAVDCTERNWCGRVLWCIRKQHPAPSDLRREREMVRFRRLKYRLLLAKRWLAVRKLTARRSPSRKLMEIVS